MKLIYSLLKNNHNLFLMMIKVFRNKYINKDRLEKNCLKKKIKK